MIPRRVLLICITGVCAAYGQSPLTVFLPPVNLAPTETAQVEITSSAAAYVGGAFISPCSAAVTFHGADGSALGTATNFTIGNSRQIFPAELPYASANATGSKTAISAQIDLGATAPGVIDVLGPPIPLCAVVYSLDTHDTATGVTHAFVTGQTTFGATFFGGIPCPSGSFCNDAIPAFGQLPENIVLPPISLSATETAEVNLLNTAPASSSGVAASCTGSVSFYDSGGTIIGTPSSFTIGTGQISPVSLPYAATGAAGSNTSIRAEITLPPPSATAAIFDPSTPPCALAYSLATYDSTTGVTHALVSGTRVQPEPIAIPLAGTPSGR
jgi:hypothetical protein